MNNREETRYFVETYAYGTKDGMIAKQYTFSYNENNELESYSVDDYKIIDNPFGFSRDDFFAGPMNPENPEFFDIADEITREKFESLEEYQEEVEA